MTLLDGGVAQQTAAELVTAERLEHWQAIRAEQTATYPHDILARLAHFAMGEDDRFYVYFVNSNEDDRVLDGAIRALLQEAGIYRGDPQVTYTAEPELVVYDTDNNVALYRWSNYYDQETPFDVYYEAVRGMEPLNMWVEPPTIIDVPVPS